ncbi:MAG: ABC transporter permease, partial [Flavobacterium sp.]|nr:ABC transporter permease [Flavobacterium sp.]
MSILKLIIKREFIAKVRNKSFIVMTFLSPLLIVALAVFVGYLASMKADVKQIAIHDESGLFASEFKNSDENKYLNLSSVDLKILKDSIVKNSYEGLIVIKKPNDNLTFERNIEYISNDSPSLDFIEDLETIIARKITKENYKKLGLDTVLIRKGIAKVDIKLKKSSGEATVKGLNAIKVGIGGAFGYLIMMFIIIYGNMVMRSVIEEKTNRIVEIIISSVKPFTLMMGKIIGTSLAGILQFFIWATIGGLLFYVFSVVLGLQMGATSTIQNQIANGANPEKMVTLQLYFNELTELPIFTILVSFLLYFIG